MNEQWNITFGHTHTGGLGGRTILTKSILQTDHSLQSVAGDDFKHKLHCASESLLSELDCGPQLSFSLCISISPFITATCGCLPPNTDLEVVDTHWILPKNLNFPC